MTTWFYWLFSQAVSIQRDIYFAFAERIKSYAESGDGSQLVVYLPMGILFGAIHALTPGHSKTLLATYTLATPSKVLQAVLSAVILSAVHISLSVLIVLLSLPVISLALGSAGQAPQLQDLSRGLIGLIGLWMIWSGFRSHGLPRSDGPRSKVFAVFAGLIPCPLTLFVMTFAVTHGVVEAGLAFSAVMMVGVAAILIAVAVLSVLARQSLVRALQRHQRVFRVLAMTLQIGTGLFLLLVAVNEISQ